MIPVPQFFWKDFFLIASVVYVASILTLILLSVQKKLTTWMTRTKSSMLFMIAASLSNAMLFIQYHASKDVYLSIAAVVLLSGCLLYNLSLFKGKNLTNLILQITYTFVFMMDAYIQHWFLSMITFILLTLVSLPVLEVFFRYFTWQIVAIHIAFATISLAVLTSLVKDHYTNLIENIHNNMRLVVHSAEFITRGETALKMPILTKEFQTILKNPSSAKASFFTKVLAKAYHAQIVFFMNREGEVLFSSEPVLIGKNYSFRKYFQDALKGRSGFTIARGHTTNKVGLFISIPVWKNQRIVGVLVYKFSPSTLFPNIVWENGWMIMHASGLVIHGPKKLWGHCIECNQNLLKEALKYKLNGRIPVNTQSPFEQKDGLLCPKGERTVEKCYILLKSPIRDEYLIARLVPLNTASHFKFTLLGIWCLIALIGSSVFFEIHRWIVLTSTDPLTGLLNRREFFNRAAEALKQAAAHNQCIHLLIMDLDDFKKINDTYGHSIGDEVLEHTSKIIRSSVKERDIVARIGGEELVVVSISEQLEDGFIIAERIRTRISQTPVASSKGKIKVTVSIGVASICFRRDTDIEKEAIEQMLQKYINIADEKMYEAKRSGKNRTAVEKILKV